MLRDLTSTVLSLERTSPELEQLDSRCCATRRRRLAAAAPADPSPRVGDRRDPTTSASYVDHSRDVGAYNPCFPDYELAVDGRPVRRER